MDDFFFFLEMYVKNVHSRNFHVLYIELNNENQGCQVKTTYSDDKIINLVYLFDKSVGVDCRYDKFILISGKKAYLSTTDFIFSDRNY